MRGELLFFCRRKRQVTVSGRFSQKVVSDDRSWEVPKWSFEYVTAESAPQSSGFPNSSTPNVPTFEKIEDRKNAQNGMFGAKNGQKNVENVQKGAKRVSSSAKASRLHR